MNPSIFTNLALRMHQNAPFGVYLKKNSGGHMPQTPLAGLRAFGAHIAVLGQVNIIKAKVGTSKFFVGTSKIYWPLVLGQVAKILNVKPCIG